MSHGCVVFALHSPPPVWRQCVAHACTPVTQRAVADPRFSFLDRETTPKRIISNNCPTFWSIWSPCMRQINSSNVIGVWTTLPVCLFFRVSDGHISPLETSSDICRKLQGIMELCMSPSFPVRARGPPGVPRGGR